MFWSGVAQLLLVKYCSAIAVLKRYLDAVVLNCCSNAAVVKGCSAAVVVWSYAELLVW